MSASIAVFALLVLCVVIAWRNLLTLPTHHHHQDKGAAVLWFLIAVALPVGVIKIYGFTAPGLLLVLLFIVENSLLLQAVAYWRGASLFDNLGR